MKPLHRSGVAGMPAVPRPPLSLLVAEPWRAAMDYLGYRLRPRPADQGDGHPVMLYPGLGADGRLLRPLRDHLRCAGYAAEDWGRGRNVGPGASVEGFIHALSDDVLARAAVCGRPLTLIGWSLGGLYAREVAKQVPRAVRMVVTLGTPFSADQDRTHAGLLFGLLNGHRPRLDAELARRLAVAPPVPTLSIYSRSDGVVPWRHCRHPEGPELPSGTPGTRTAHVRDLEVRSSHLSMPWNRQVLRAVRDALRHSPGHPADGSAGQDVGDGALRRLRARQRRAETVDAPHTAAGATGG